MQLAALRKVCTLEYFIPNVTSHKVVGEEDSANKKKPFFNLTEKTMSKHRWRNAKRNSTKRNHECGDAS